VLIVPRNVEVHRFKGWRDFGDRHRSIGPIVCIASIQYFIIQFVVALRWSPSYSIGRNTISDLGNTACGRFNGRYVCSPLHSLMNVSFVILGVSMIAGGVLIRHSLSSTRSRPVTIGFRMFELGGVGVILVGLFPENSVPAFHGIGATLPFLVGNAGVVLLGLTLKVPSTLRLFTLIAGVVALVALVFYASSHYLGLGEGGIERIVAYPQTIWLIAIGIYGLLQLRQDQPGSAVRH
jgi:hypothetical membrane protein